MALLSALTSFMHIPMGFTNRTLREQVADPLDSDHKPYGVAQMSYDLRRLRLKGIIWRIPDSYRYQLTTYGRKAAVFFAKLGTRIFRRFLAALDPTQPIHCLWSQPSNRSNKLSPSWSITRICRPQRRNSCFVCQRSII